MENVENIISEGVRAGGGGMGCRNTGYIYVQILIKGSIKLLLMFMTPDNEE